MIYTLTANPSLDYLLYAESFNAGKINRSRSEKLICGGKGINVSVMLSRLGVRNTALGFVGGFVGEEIKRLVRAEGVICGFTEISHNSRINVKIFSESETALNACGPFVSEEEENVLLERLAELGEDDTLVFSGKLAGDSVGFLEKTLSINRKPKLVVDMEGEDLKKAIEYRPYLIKPNEEELCALFGTDCMDEEKTAAAASKLRREGCENVLVSRGESGAILASDDGNIYRIKAPRGKVISTVGAGDSMLAGFLAGISRGAEYALALGTAAGSATAFSEDLADSETVCRVLCSM
mgnify:CR=1 FL=1